jgi:hypothetical protein
MPEYITSSHMALQFKFSESDCTAKFINNLVAALVILDTLEADSPRECQRSDSLNLLERTVS